MTTINSYTDNEITVVAEARRQVAAGIAPIGLIERAYRVIERYPYDPNDDGIIAAASHAGIVQVCFLERDGFEGWSRMQLSHAGNQSEPVDVLVFRQSNPERLYFDVSLEIAATRLAKALPKTDPRQGELATLVLARAAVRKALHDQVAELGPKASKDAVGMVHAIGDAWDDHHRRQLCTIAETPASYAAASTVAA